MTQHISNARSGQQSTELAGKAGACASTRLLSRRVDFTLRCFEPFRDLVAVLVASHGEERQQGCHRWIATTHNMVLFDTCFRCASAQLEHCPGTIRSGPCGAAREHAPYDKHYYRADHGSYEPGTFASMIPADCLPQESGDECPRQCPEVSSGQSPK